MAKSFRLQFIDQDSSYTLNTTEAAVKGYIVCRAPKGTTEARYFNYGNEDAINAMIGLPTANWVDLYEAIAFNREYGLYISAPPGSGDDYSSYYGGVYLTTRGPYDYWQVSDVDEPSFEVGMIPGEEPAKWGGSDATSSEVSIYELNLDSQSTIKISGISSAIFAKMNYINLDYWGYGNCPVSAGTVAYKLDGSTISGKLYYVDPEEGIDTKLQCGYYKLNGSTYDIYIGGNSSTVINGKTVTVSNNTATSNAPWICFDELLDFSKKELVYTSAANTSIKVTVNKTVTVDSTMVSTYKNDPNTTVEDYIKSIQPDATLGTGVNASTLMSAYTAGDLIAYTYESEVTLAKNSFYPIVDNGITYSEQSDLANYYKNLLLKGISSELDITRVASASANKTVTLDTFLGIDSGSRFMLRVNIKALTFARVHQKSCNETPTYIEISNIGYDKWKYDQSCAAIKLSDITGSITTEDSTQTSYDGNEGSEVSVSNLSKIVLSAKLQTAITLGNSDGLVIISNGTPGKKDFAIYQLASSGIITDVTSAYKTQRFYINGLIASDYSTSANADDNYSYTVWEVKSSSSKGLGNHEFYQCTESSSTYPLKKDINFNTLTISSKEIVIPGEYTSGGEYTGSLSETGKDSYGANIYFPNIMPENIVNFIDVVPVQTIDSITGAINDQGFFTGSKIVDPIGPAKDTYSNYLKGQRYCTHVNELNQADGTLGCAWRDEYYQIILDGLNEAQNPKYDDALVFMEPTGYEEYKAVIMSLRVKYHDTSTFISPKIITKAELNNPSSITVSGRSKGTAQYIGEFKKYDTYTGKYYWCQPIGDVGLQLARIMDKKLGGIAPAGTNDSSGLGGCLSRAVLSAKWDFSDEALEILDQKGLCAITYDADNGLMIQSQKSTQDPSTVTDWSYLGHSMSFDLCKREIRDKVMVNQVFKRINSYWMDIRTKQVQAILNKRTTGNDPIWASATVDITGQNTSTTMAARQFVIKVTCKVYVYSESVLLIFENLAQE